MVNESSDAPLFRLGLIGYPLGHSYSAEYFNSKFKELNIPGEYNLYPIADVKDVLTLLEKDRKIIGLNVTIPHKQTILPYLNELSEDAREIGAVNVVTARRDTESCDKLYLKGYNTDWIGFRNSLRQLLREDVTRALVLGTGGSSRAVAYALRRLGIKVDFVSRSRKHSLPDGARVCTYDELDENDIKAHLLIVNTTPVGMYPHTDERPQIPYEALTPEHLCFDLIYNPDETEFLKASAKAGAKVKNGLEMLHIQADETWKITQGIIENLPSS